MYLFTAYLLINLIICLILLHFASTYKYFAFTHFYLLREYFSIYDDIKRKWFHHRKHKEIYNLGTIPTQED